MFEEQGGPLPNHNNGDGMSSVGTASPDLFNASNQDESQTSSRRQHSSIAESQLTESGYNTAKDIIITQNDLDTGEWNFWFLPNIFTLFSHLTPILFFHGKM